MRAESVTSTLVYTYTAGGLLVGRSDSSVPSVDTYAWDWASGLPEMLSEGSNLYLVGHETLGQWDGDEWAYYLSDALGSVRQVTDETGAVVDGREWTPYGVEVGVAQAGLGYTGEWQDASLGLTYLRARWYDASNGQFLSRDPWPGMPQHPRSLQPYSYASNSPTVCVDPLGLYSCLTGERWPLDLIPLCLLLDSSPEARYLFYEHVIVAGMGAIGWNDAAIFLGHYLDATGETMYFGSGLVRLIERDAAHVIDNKRMEYLSGAARGMGGRAGILPWLSDDQTVFMSNTEGIPTWYASEVYPLSQEVWIALGGFWFDRSYGGKVEEKVQGTYHISLWTVFSVDKRWSFAPNVEMGMTENPPAEFNIADRIGIPGWLPRPYLLPPIFPFPIIIPDNAWTLYIPDEWGQALEDDGYAASFWAKGTWARYEQFLAVDHNCDGWDVDDILGEPMIVSEILPTGVDPAPSMSYEQFSRFD